MADPYFAFLRDEPAVVSAGAAIFNDALREQAVPLTVVDWAPPRFADPAHIAAVAGDPRRHAANKQALDKVLAARSELVDVRPASEALGLKPGQFLHAGPPISWERASGPMRGALIGAMIFEGLAATPEDAENALASGTVELDSCHHRHAVGTWPA